MLFFVMLGWWYCVDVGADLCVRPQYEKNGGFRVKTAFEFWLSEEGLCLLAGWARNGSMHREIAKKMGVSGKALSKLKEEYRGIGEALRKSREVIDMEVEEALLKKALSGDVRACSYWLKNRRGDVWKDRPKDFGDGEDGIFEDSRDGGISRLSQLIMEASGERDLFEEEG